MQSSVFIRGDLASVHMGTYVILREDVIIRPSYNKQKVKLRYVPMTIGDHVYVDRGSVIQA